MVSNEEISQRLKNKREGKSLNGYLVCNNCGGYYELQQGESPKHFDLDCECGGQLVQSVTDSLIPPEAENEPGKYMIHILISNFLIFVFWPFAAAGAYYLLNRDNERANFHGKIITVICLPCFLITLYSLYVGLYIGLMQATSLRLFLPCV